MKPDMYDGAVFSYQGDFLDYLMSDFTGASESVRNEAMAWKRMSEDIDMLRAIVGDLERIE